MIEKIYFILAMIIAFYISVNSVQNFSIKFEILDEIIKEFQKGYIENIIVLQNSTDCPKDYQSLVQNFNWPGNNKGCACKSENQNEVAKFKFYTGYCPRMVECYSIEETELVYFNKWRNNLICYKRAKSNYNHIPILEIDDFETCNNKTHRVCGIIDGRDNLLCLPKNESCPITTMKFLSKVDLEFYQKNNSLQETDIKSTNTSQEEKIFKLNDDFYFYTNRKELNSNASSLRDNRIFSFFRIDLTTPCFNPVRSPSSENFFPLLKNKFDLMCDRYENGTEITDSSFVSIDEYSFEEYYRDNNFYHKLHKIIDPFKLTIPSETIKIYAKSFPGWNRRCEEQNKEALRSFLGMPDQLNGILISVIIHSFISIGVIIAIGVFSCYLSKYFELLFKAVNLGFIVLNIIYPIQIISNSNWVVNILSDENGAFCGDNSINLLLVEVSSSCLSLQYSFILILLLAIFSCIIFLYSLYSWIKPATQEVHDSLLEMRN